MFHNLVLFSGDLFSVPVPRDSGFWVAIDCTDELGGVSLRHIVVLWVLYDAGVFWKGRQSRGSWLDWYGMGKGGNCHTPRWVRDDKVK